MKKEEANLPAPSSSSSSTTTSSDLHHFSSLHDEAHPTSRPDLLRHVQAALKRHRPLGTMQSGNFRARRVLVPQRVPSSGPACSSGNLVVDSENSLDVTLKEEKPTRLCDEQQKAERNCQSSVTPPSATATVTETYGDDNVNPFCGRKVDNVASSSHVCQPISTGEKKVHFSLGENAPSQGADERMATSMEFLSSHMNYLALTEMERDVSNMVEQPDVNNQDKKQRDPQPMEACDVGLGPDGGISSLLAKRSMLMKNSVLGKEISHPMNQLSAGGSSCMTTISVHSKSAPALNSTTYSLRPCQDGSSQMDFEPLEVPNVNRQYVSQGYPPQLSYPTYQSTSGMLADSSAATTQMSVSSLVTTMGVKDHGLSKGQREVPSKEVHRLVEGANEDKAIKEKGNSGDVTDVQSQAPMTKSTCTSEKADLSKSDKQEKAGSSKGAPGHRKKGYDPDVFVKVNGKLYQKLGKIGSGGSSEVYKVISSDCTIYALKRIKLKGRDYSTAYGFCQEIEYLNKLKGMNNIIQLIDYEVTDKTLLEEVLNGAMNIKDGRIRDDGYIYMVLEYGEIDLAHMLSHKWKEQEDSSTWSLDDNWLRFYWQQILQAVNTIHEERIVHSDLKPANFLLVKGSLKLIDFGIAKAIMSDTTNIQRDSQVGTLSYMSPEAFMCNETDTNGNPIKCGRPSDIWSLGCILYQMVYGRTPFSEYKTFWAKFKVITDPTHKITYPPVSNPYLLDLMKKCLAWQRNDRWRIPQLLQHPFLVPPISTPLGLFREIGEKDDEVAKICEELEVLVRGGSGKDSISSVPRVASLCYELKRYLEKMES